MSVWPISGEAIGIDQEALQNQRCYGGVVSFVGRENRFLFFDSFPSPWHLQALRPTAVVFGGLRFEMTGHVSFLLVI